MARIRNFVKPLVFSEIEYENEVFKVPVDNNGIFFSIEEVKEIIENLIFYTEKFNENFIKKEIEEQKKDLLNSMYQTNYTPKRKVTYEGYVYFLKDLHSDTFKIGASKDVGKRNMQISPQLPFKTKIEFVFKTKDMYKLEKELHNFFRGFNLNGEWFDLTKFDKNKIEYVVLKHDKKAILQVIDNES